MKIALVAMSGIRVVDEKLVELGLTLPGFVERSKVIASLPSLGLLTLAGIETDIPVEYSYMEIPDLKEVKNIESMLGGYDAVAISTFSAQVDEAYDLGDVLKKIGIPVIIGGLHVTAESEEAMAHADSVVVGEGEVFWNQLITDLASNNLKRKYDSTGIEFDLADAPMPRFDLLDMDKYNRLTVQTSRGCPHQCVFCGSSPLLTQTYKQKPAEKILAEIDSICDIWEKPFIEFADDNTFVNHTFWKKLLPELGKRNFRWFTETDISIAQDEELLGMMRDAGCAQILIGLESPVTSSLNGVELHNNWKMKKAEEYLQSIEKIQSYGISVNGCFVFGMDNQDTDIFDESLAFIRRSKLQEVQITIQTPFPGTPLYGQLVAEDRLLGDSEWKKCTLFDVMYQPAKMSEQELSDGFKRMLSEVYSPEETANRKQYFREAVKYHKAHH